MATHEFPRRQTVAHRLAALAWATLLIAAAAPAFAATSATVHVILDNLPSGKQILRLDKKSVGAGKVTFDVSNISKNEEHEFLVVRTKLAANKLPMNADGTRVAESALKGIHELGHLAPGKTGTLTLNLAPGHYVLFCNKIGHYTGGMESGFTVT